jgi:hypothetical protein
LWHKKKHSSALVLALGDAPKKCGLIRPGAFLGKNFFLKRSMPMTQAASAAKNAKYRQK